MGKGLISKVVAGLLVTSLFFGGITILRGELPQPELASTSTIFRGELPQPELAFNLTILRGELPQPELA